MAKRATDSKIVPQCANCCLSDYSEGYCTAFQDPAYQWRDGECWGRCDTAQEMVARLEAMVNYALPGANTTPIRRELDAWRETVRELEAFDNYYDDKLGRQYGGEVRG